jgi:glycosyltransferase involved in cell wall biosynthesis
MEPLIAPKVSVLIPAYNAESTVEAALASILRQTFADFEVVVVNDGSTDSTPAILRAIARHDSRVRVIDAPRGGIINALNTGIAECRGDLIARMDADDISHPRRLEMQVALMDAHPEVGVCSCLVRMFPRAKLLGGLVRYEQWLNSLMTHEQIARDMFVESPVAHPSAMVRREELIEVGGYQERGWAEDYDLWLRYHVAGGRFAKVDSTLVFWRQSEGRLTFTDPRYSVENFLRAKAHYLAKVVPSPVRCARPIILWGAGKTGRRLSKHLLREGVDFQAAIDIDPIKIGRTMRGKPIVGVDYLRERCFGISTDQSCQIEQNRNPETAQDRGCQIVQDRNPETALPFVIAAVSSHGARELIREQLRQLGFSETHDFICAA